MTQVYLWIGIEDFTWTVANFQPVIAFAKQHNIDGLLVKVFDGMQGEWYKGQFPQIFTEITSAGLGCVPYGFHYGNNKGSSLTGEAQLGLKYMQNYSTYCADMESSWDGQGDEAKQLASIWANHPGKLWISTWANVGDEAGGHMWLTNISHLNPVVDMWLPQAYSDSLYSLMQQDWPHGLNVQPTFDLSAEDGTNHPNVSAEDFCQNLNKQFQPPSILSLWEYNWARQFPSTLDSVVAAAKGDKPVPVILNKAGMVANFVPVSQFEPNETEFACGFFGGSSLRSATPPNMPTKDSGETVDTWADGQYKAVYGSFDASQSGGISIDELHIVLHNAGLHYWDITAIAPGSTQSSDIANIKAALSAGYPMIATVVEASVRDLTGDIPAGNPYEWNPVCNNNSCPTHVIVYVGIASDGNLLAIDYANVVGPLQGSNTVRPWPRKYDIGCIDNTYGCMVQLVGPDPNNPWLKPIPSGDPTSWPEGFNGQNFLSPMPPLQPPINNQLKQFQDIWNSTAGLFGGTSPSSTTGIASEWQTKYMTKFFIGPPLTKEIQTVDWNGQSIVIQVFTNGMAQWINGAGRWWIEDKEVTF